MKIEDVMTSDVLTCRTDDTLVQVVRKMTSARVTSVWVVDAGQGRRLEGIVRGSDLVRAAGEQREPLERLRVRDVMCQDVHWCWPSDTVEAAQVILSAYALDRLPVVDLCHEVLGQVTKTDVARAIARGRPHDAQASQGAAAAGAA